MANANRRIISAKGRHRGRLKTASKGLRESLAPS